MIIIGLTGSIAMGKTTAANMLRDMRDVAVHDSDGAVHELYKNPVVIDAVKNAFPDSYNPKDKSIDKKKLLALLGQDHDQWDIIENILHPYVRDSQQKFIQEQRRQGTKFVVLDIPLLFETQAQNRVDYTICVTAPDFIQRERVLKGRGMPEEDFEFRSSRQMPDAEKRVLADFVVHTGQGVAYTRQTLQNIMKQLTEEHFNKDNQNENRRIPPFDL